MQSNTIGAEGGVATHVVDVKVDVDLGIVTVLRYTSFQDVGRAIHPAYVEGQMQGGAAQSIGWALNEEYIYNKKGQVDNLGFLDYRTPVCSDPPMLDAVLIEVPNPKHPQGIRGVGEVPLVPPLAAISNALYRALGTRFYALPMSPPKVLAALDAGTAEYGCRGDEGARIHGPTLARMRRGPFVVLRLGFARVRKLTHCSCWSAATLPSKWVLAADWIPASLTDQVANR